MAVNYKEHLNDLKKSGIEPRSGDLHDYEAFPLEEVFEMFYQLAQDYLDRTDNPVDLRPGKFFFTNNLNVNAGAWKHEGKTYIAEMCQGTMRLMFNFFTGLNDKFDQPELEKYKHLVEIKGIDPGYFLYQLVTSYFLYHEAGHLIQAYD